MTGLFARLRGWFGGLFSGSDEGAADESSAAADSAADDAQSVTDDAAADDTTDVVGPADAADSADDPALQCTVCGTTAEAGAERCPLCRSSDLRPADEVDAEDVTAADEGKLRADKARVSRQADDADADDPADRLREFRRDREE